LLADLGITYEYHKLIISLSKVLSSGRIWQALRLFDFIATFQEIEGFDHEKHMDLTKGEFRVVNSCISYM